MAYFPVRAEWDDEESGAHVVAEGQTENVGPEGALVHLERLPRVGGRVQLAVLEDEEFRRGVVSTSFLSERELRDEGGLLRLVAAGSPSA